MNQTGLRFHVFQKCMDALRVEDHDAVLTLLDGLRLSDGEPDAIALANKIRNQIGHKVRQSKRIPDVVIAERQETSPAKPGNLLSAQNEVPPLPGISLVAGCMNREGNLLKVLPSWLATKADEIVIVDWSSASELWPQLAQFDDPRLKVIRIDGEKNWVAAHALNVGFRSASHELVYRVDCDIALAPDFLETNSIKPGEFIRGFWKSGLEHGGDGQQFIQGTFGAWKNDLRATNYYDESILTYGWEDSEIYVRLSHDLGLAGRLVNPGSLKHIEQAEEQRLANQSVPKNRFLGKYEPTEFEGAKNKYYATLSGSWGSYSPSQDYELSQVSPRQHRGRRITKSIPRNQELERISEIFAIRQLAAWASTTTPEIGTVKEHDIGFIRLLRDVHVVNKSREFVNSVKNSEGLYFIQCAPGPCRLALLKTIQVMRSHYPQFEQSLVLAEGEPESLTECVTHGDRGNVFVTSGDQVKRLSERARATELNCVGDLEMLLESGDRKAAFLSLNIRSLAAEVIDKAAQFAEKLGAEFESLPSPVLGARLVTSLYDEQNLVRLVEYLACVVENLKVFEQVVIYYEASTGLLAEVLHQISDDLAIAPGRLLLLPYQKRPTFEVLFSVKAFLPAGSIVAVSNADIVFDASFSKLAQVDLLRNVVVLSRRDISDDGSKASLIRLDSGYPNTFSADAWIVRTPFEPDFFLDYLIGTMQCDSYINHQVGISERYNVINPCFDIKVFHLHDERFNSSAEKQKRDIEVITKNYNAERARNGDVDPIKGVAWSTLASAAIIPSALQIQQWRPKGLVLNLADCGRISFGHLLILHQMANTAARLADVALVVRLKKHAVDGVLGKFLARYQTHFSRRNFLLDIADVEFDAVKAVEQGTCIRTHTFEHVADWIIKGQSDNAYEFFAWPQVHGTKLLRCELRGDVPAVTTQELIGAMKRHDPDALNALFEFFNALPNYSADKNMIAPFIVPQLGEGQVGVPKGNGRPAVSFVTSLFNGGEFLSGYLENVLAAAKAANGEVIIIDANPDERDSPVVRDFLTKHPDAQDCIDYLRLDHDPGLYECWRIGIERSKADLITNANIDDRRCPYHTARLVQHLNEHPEYAGACGSISCVKNDAAGDWFTLSENQLWFYNEGIKEVGYHDLYVTSPQGEVKSRDVMHCMPVWRKSLHERFGYFDEAAYGTSADWAFWLKCSKAGAKFLFDESAFGRYFMNPDSHNRRNDPEGIKELRIIKDFIGVEQSHVKKQ